jgi:hypothetical protein
VSTFLGWALDEPELDHDGYPVSPLIEARTTHEENRWAVVTPYADEVPHELDVGSTGGGKSTALRVGAIDLVQDAHRVEEALVLDGADSESHKHRQTRIIICDGKGGNSFKFLAGQPGVVALPNSVDAITDAVLSIYDETRLRYEDYDKAREQAWATGREPDYEAPGWLHLWIDEYMSWILQVPAGRGGEGRQAVLDALINTGQISREVRVRIRLATQRPDVKSVDVGLPGLLKAQLKMRCALTGAMGMDSTESWMAFDDSAWAKLIGTVPGSGLAVSGGRAHHFRVPWVPDPTDPDRKITQKDRDRVWAMLPRDREQAVIEWERQVAA